MERSQAMPGHPAWAVALASYGPNRIRAAIKQEPRKHLPVWTVGTRLTDRESAQCERSAAPREQTLSEWCHQLLLELSDDQKVEKHRGVHRVLLQINTLGAFRRLSILVVSCSGSQSFSITWLSVLPTSRSHLKRYRRYAQIERTGTCADGSLHFPFDKDAAWSYCIAVHR